MFASRRARGDQALNADRWRAFLRGLLQTWVLRECPTRLSARSPSCSFDMHIESSCCAQVWNLQMAQLRPSCSNTPGATRIPLHAVFVECCVKAFKLLFRNFVMLLSRLIDGAIEQLTAGGIATKGPVTALEESMGTTIAKAFMGSR